MKKSEETKAKHRKWKATPEIRAKMSAARIGKRQSDEAIAKVAAFHRGRKRSSETCRRIADSKKKLSVESRLRISAGQKGRPVNWEWVDRMALLNRGKKLPPRSPEHCSAIGKAKKAAFARGRAAADLVRQGYPLSEPTAADPARKTPTLDF